jgi:hypothetical protein
VINNLKSQLSAIEGELSRTERRIAVTGGQKVGKTSLINQFNTMESVAGIPLEWVETPALFTIDGNRDQEVKKVTDRSDLVLFLITGDITATEYQYLETLAKDQRVLLVLNKNDQFLPEELTLITAKIQSVLNNTLTPVDIISTAVDPALIKVRKLKDDGTTEETIEKPPVVIDSLSQRLEQVLQKESESLLWSSTYRQVNGVKNDAKIILNQRRQDKAIPAIEQYQWIAAGTAFANPLPALDLLATAAINAQMIVDLGNIYQQKFTLDQAQAIAKTMGEVILKLGVVELVTQTVSNILKTNALTYIAGGFIQGVSAAYLTNIAGLAMIEYFAAQDVVLPTTNSNWNSELLSNILSNVVKNNQRMTYFQNLVQQGMDRLVVNS